MIAFLKYRYSNHYLDPLECRRALSRLLFLLALLYAASWAAQAHADAHQLDNPQSGHMVLKNDEGKQQQALHLQSAVFFDIRGLHAKVKLTQTFSNNSLEWVEGIYKFPLPPSSAVNAMTMTIGDRVIKGEIKEKQQAKKLYTQAKNAGKKAALVEQERPNMFTQSVANIGPGESVTVELSYLQNIRYDMGEFSLRFPMTITPRYIPGVISLENLNSENQDSTHTSLTDSTSPSNEDALSQQLHSGSLGWALPTNQVPDAHKITPFQTLTKHPIQISVRLNAGVELDDLSSPSHNVFVDHHHDHLYSVEPISQTVAMDKDFELVWRAQPNAEPTAAIFHERFDEESYVQLMLLPPYAEQKHAIPRELILVVDTSGSMAGTSIQQAKQSVQFALNQLTSLDRFNVIEFNSNFRSLFSEPQPAQSAQLQQAQSFIANLNAGGGTEMASALRAALKKSSIEEETHLRQVVFITDGAVGNEQALFQLINEQLGKTRLFTVGIGSAPNSYFMEQAAEFGRGTFTHIGNVTQVDERMRALLRKLASPALAGLQIKGPHNFAGEQYPSSIPDLYLGEPLIVNAKYSGVLSSGDTVHISGKTANTAWEKKLKLSEPSQVSLKNDEESGGAIVSTLWARSKLKHLLQQKIHGTPEEKIKGEALPLALRFQLMSPYTSFLAAEETISRPKDSELNSKAIANTVPAGQKPLALQYPSTATPAFFNAIIGCFAALALMLLRVQRRVCYAV